MKFPSFFTSIAHKVPEPKLPREWRILITGVTSIHGWPIFQRLRELLPKEQLCAIRPVQTNQPDDDNVVPTCITNYEELVNIKQSFNPTHVIHGVGVCDLDACEARPEWAREINVNGSAHIASLFGESAYIMYLSSDLVFSGNQPPPNGYCENHATDPVSVVGQTFLDAEKEIQQARQTSIIRLALPTGDSITGTKGAVDFIEKRFKRNLPMTLFYDECRSCIDCKELAETILHLLSKEAKGLYHLGGNEEVSLYDLGVKLINRGNYAKHLLKRSSRHDELNGPPRIGNVALNSFKLKQWFAREFQIETLRK